MIKGVIFDMDGVLVDTESFYQRRRETFLQQMDFQSPINANFIGSNEQAIWKTLIPEDSEFRQEMLMGYRAYRRLHPIPYGELLDPQVPDVFAQLKLEGIKIAIASSSGQEAVRQMTEIAGVDSLVDYIISGEDCIAHKPEPEIYLRAMEALELTPENALAVEDSPTGITAARRAGLRVYAVRPRDGVELDQSAATAIIDQLTELWPMA